MRLGQKKLIRLIFKRLDTEEKTTKEEAAHESNVSFILSFFLLFRSSTEGEQEGGQIRSGLKNATILVGPIHATAFLIQRD